MKKISRSKPHTDKRDLLAVSRQIASGMHATGARAEEFEKALCEYVGVKYGRAVNSGTNAIFIALNALNVGQEDEVVLPSYVCQSVLSAVLMTGAKPVFADVLKGSVNIGVQTVKGKIGKKTKAVIVPHMFGAVADVEGIKKLGAPVIEDCAQAIGASFSDGSKVGSKGDLAIFSFYATKVISTGQGGMVLTNSKKLWGRVKDLTTYDGKKKYSIGYNFGLSDIQAALGLNQLKKIGGFVEKRRKIGAAYDQVLGVEKKESGSFPFRYLVWLKDFEEKERLKKYLIGRGIKSDEPVFNPLHLSFNEKGYNNTENTHSRVLSIPLYPALTNHAVKYIVLSLTEFFNS